MIILFGLALVELAVVTLPDDSGRSDSYAILSFYTYIFFSWFNVMNIVFVNEMGGVGL